MPENKLFCVRHLCFEILHIRLHGDKQLAVDPHHHCTRHSVNISFSCDNSHNGLEKLLCSLYIAQLFLLLLPCSCSFKSDRAIVCSLMVLLHQYIEWMLSQLYDDRTHSSEIWQSFKSKPLDVKDPVGVKAV